MIQQLTLERFTHQPTSLEPVYKLTLDLVQRQVVWQGRENVQTRGRVVAQLNDTQLTTLQQMLGDLPPATLTAQYHSESPQTTYEVLTLVNQFGKNQVIHNAYGRYCPHSQAFEQLLAKVPLSHRAEIQHLMTFTFKLDQLMHTHQMIGQRKEPTLVFFPTHKSEGLTELETHTDFLTLTKHILPQLTLEETSHLLAKLQKRDEQLTYPRNLQGLRKRLQGIQKLRDALAKTFDQPQQRQPHLERFQNLQKAFAASMHPYDQVIWEDLQEAIHLHPVKTQPNTHQICQILEYVLGKNHPEIVPTYIRVLENVKHRLTHNPVG